MAGIAVEHTDGATVASTPRPYRPSWLDVLTEWVDSLPVPSRLVYVATWLVLAVIVTTVKWSDGGYTADTFSPLYLVFPAIAIYGIPFVHYIDKVAAGALDSCRPLITLNDQETGTLRYKLTTMPWRSTLLISLTASVVGPLLVRNLMVLDRGITFQFSRTMLGSLIDIALAALTGATAMALLYHTFRQLALVSRILTHHIRIDLYETQPLYALSNITARTALGLLIPIYTWVWVGLGGWNSSIGPITTMVYTAFGAFLFAWPLTGVHRLLEREKQRLQIEVGRRMKNASADLHRRLDAQDLSGVTDLKDAMEGLVMEKADLDKISTWPWQPETARWLVTALLLPVLLWVIQSVLSRLLAL